jgi:hypothetical protein
MAVNIGPIASKLQRLLLMLSSDQPGEVVAAAAAIKRTLQSGGCDFHDLASELTSPSSAKPKFEEQPEPPRAAPDWHEMRDFCLAYPERLRTSERDFVESLIAWRGRLTEKQMNWLTSIFERIS